MHIHQFFREDRLAKACKYFLWPVFICGVIGVPAVHAQEAGKDQTPPAQTSPKDDDIEQLRKMVRQLSAEVGRLKAEVAKLEKYKQIDYLREQLMKEEQRVEALQQPAELNDGRDWLRTDYHAFVTRRAGVSTA